MARRAQRYTAGIVGAPGSTNQLLSLPNPSSHLLVGAERARLVSASNRQPFCGRACLMNIDMVQFLRLLGSRAWPLALTTVLLPIAARPAEACSCFANPPCAAVWKADAVFVGTVIDRVQEPVGGSISWTVHSVAVNQRLHGAIDSFIALVPGNRPSPEQIEASTSHSALGWVGSSCDFNFELGRQYIIYARKTADGRWTTSLCSGTKLVEEAAEDLDYIATVGARERHGYATRGPDLG